MSSRTTATVVEIANTGPLKAIERHLYWISMIAKLILTLLVLDIILRIPTGGDNLI
jgi:hypothetical protein